MILPIWIFKDEEWKVIGTGFLIEPVYLLTAGHNIYTDPSSIEKFKTRINGSDIILDDCKYLEYKLPIFYSSEDVIYQDLAIYIIPSLIGFKSDLQLSNDFDNNSSVEMVGFSDSDQFLDRTVGNITKRYESDRNSEKQVFYNCFKISNSPKVGNSGGPVLIGNKVCGMIVYANLGNDCTALRSSYILQRINDL